MKKFGLILLITLGSFWPLFAQDAAGFGISFSGYVKTDFFCDTRQNVTIREGHFLLFPLRPALDARGKDINADASFNILSIQTRLTGNIKGPDAFGAKTSGVVEADFFGNENAAFVDANGFRLRHAFVRLNWATSELLLGQYWHPLFIPNNFSGVVSFNTGAPFQPFSRNPQVRFTQRLDNLYFMAALNSQRDFTSPGGSTALRNSAVPEASLQARYETKNGPDELQLGVGGSYKRIEPYVTSTTVDGKTYKTDSKVESMAATAFFKYANSSFTYKLQGVYGGNLYDLTMLGGYGQTRIIDTTSREFAFAPMKTASVWTEFITNIDNVRLGLWAGYTENLGAGKRFVPITAAVRGGDIKNLIRISPRVEILSGKLNFAFEGEYTMANYSRVGGIDENGVVTDYDPVANFRALFSTIYSF
ncbi:MAG: hypothetical protein ACM3U1_01145 [Chloroflexota bacterium]